MGTVLSVDESRHRPRPLATWTELREEVDGRNRQ
jgi:hypothetical protein